jgi:hypothetical protein
MIHIEISKIVVQNFQNSKLTNERTKQGESIHSLHHEIASRHILFEYPDPLQHEHLKARVSFSFLERIRLLARRCADGGRTNSDLHRLIFIDVEQR